MTEMGRTLLIKRTFLAALVAVLCFGFLPARAAEAQSQTIISVQPEDVEIPLGNEVVLELTVTLGLNVNAFDLTVEYDPDLLDFVKWENGDYLKNLAVVKKVDDAGSFRLAATQLAQPAVSGDGVLIKLTFDTVGAGESAIHIFEATFADSEGNKMEPVTVDGLVAVTLTSTFTPTPTPTRTPTTKPTLTPTPEPGGGTAYPVKNEITATLTSQPTGNLDGGGYIAPGSEEPLGTAYPEGESLPSEPVGQEMTPAAYSGSASGDNDRETGVTSSGEEQGGGTSDQPKESSETSKSDLNVFLWVVLSIMLIAMAVMVRIAIQRRRNKGEDLLL